MGDRYRFTREDIEKHIGRIVQRPDARRLLERVIPVKRFAGPVAALEQVPEDLPVKVRSRNNPDGVPLAEVAKLVKAKVPGVRSIMVRDGRVIVAYEKKPTREVRDQLTRLAGDKESFRALAAKRPPPEVHPDAPEEELRAKLLEPAISDEEWMKNFRRLQVRKLAAEAKLPPR